MKHIPLLISISCPLAVEMQVTAYSRLLQLPPLGVTWSKHVFNPWPRKIDGSLICLGVSDWPVLTLVQAVSYQWLSMLMMPFFCYKVICLLMKWHWSLQNNYSLNVRYFLHVAPSFDHEECTWLRNKGGISEPLTISSYIWLILQCCCWYFLGTLEVASLTIGETVLHHHSSASKVMGCRYWFACLKRECWFGI